MSHSQFNVFSEHISNENEESQLPANLPLDPSVDSGVKEIENVLYTGPVVNETHFNDIYNVGQYVSLFPEQVDVDPNDFDGIADFVLSHDPLLAANHDGGYTDKTIQLVTDLPAEPSNHAQFLVGSDGNLMYFMPTVTENNMELFGADGPVMLCMPTVTENNDVYDGTDLDYVPPPIEERDSDSETGKSKTKRKEHADKARANRANKKVMDTDFNEASGTIEKDTEAIKRKIAMDLEEIEFIKYMISYNSSVAARKKTLSVISRELSEVSSRSRFKICYNLLRDDRISLQVCSECG